ncbi:hypothetical protein [Hahella sp. HN01]|uniref:hypothetical protein n=1 Tax=Hahella sp. HN01 TaxID=2847262 RepID=UPI001C1ECEDE|nr:hypothetical protein [Hahella sp. HN01]MBU6952036.1 hypothetical protein [Hahella sp. HN01]
MNTTRTPPTAVDPFRVEEKLTLSVVIDNPDADWRKGQAVIFKRALEASAGSDVLEARLDTGTRLGQICNTLIAKYLQAGGKARAKIINRPGLSFLPAKKGQLKTALVEVRPDGLDWSLIDPIIQRDNEIAYKITEAAHFSKRQPSIALAFYQDAINDIIDLHFENPLADHWRRVIFPVNELSALLESQKEYKRAYETIRAYEAFDDKLGLPPEEMAQLQKRKRRLKNELRLNDGELKQGSPLYSKQMEEVRRLAVDNTVTNLHYFSKNEG